MNRGIMGLAKGIKGAFFGLQSGTVHVSTRFPSQEPAKAWTVPLCLRSIMKAVSRKPVIALYGNVELKRGYCPKCKTTSFVKNGKLVCCDTPYDKEPKKYHRVCAPTPHRKHPPLVEQARILQEQEHGCFYCQVQFGETVYRHGKPVTLKIHWDHQLPYAYSQNNSSANFVAACQVCNGIKSDKIFHTVEEAQVYLANERKSKGYNF